ncbi:Triacylglycerol lipase [Handroanthus impetiginosus]|uniref:Triacylglycerol lipase n=1 Tax=Handroanthus impetiginosus TaxID=429701 RepID=A0A2G9HNB7_9LAMI|nr:Triacylglycerol lipase [Handroanthus impetiginosus]
MTPQTPPQNLALFSLFLFTFFPPSLSYFTVPQSKIKGIFVFGSSVVDNGNNNFLANATAKANYLPYGIDFPLGPTGRFTNGKNIIDVLGEKLGLPNYIPPFKDPSTKGSKIIHGVNYGSGDSGILDNTSSSAGSVISLNQQIRNFGKAGLANNVTIQDFTANLITTLSNQLKRLYNLGARKFVLVAIYPSGCSPTARARVPNQKGCLESLNRAVLMFNDQLKKLVDDIRPEMPGSNLVFVNAYKVIKDIITFPSLKGFRDSTNACCEVNKTSEGGIGTFCKRGGSVCTNRREYVYFDGLHLTEAVQVIIANKALFSNLQTEVYPYNVKHLSQI